MNKLLSIGLAFAVAGFAPTLEAAPGKQKGGKGHGKPVAMAQKAPAMKSKAIARNPAPIKSKAIVRGPSRPNVQRSAPGRSQNQLAAQARVQRNQSVRIANQNAQQRAAVRSQRESIAFGGSRVRSSDFDRRDRDRNDYSYRPPYDIYRNWDRGRIHEWNDRRYRWHNNTWIVFEGGYDYPSYSTYDVAPTYAVTTRSDSSLVADVQDALEDRGYDPGPIDGVMGSGTRNAIAAFQSDNGLEPTGRINNSLLRSLDLE